MSYQRVIPRDLFNEANLLKCYGQLYVKLEILNENVELRHEYNTFGTTEFRVAQDPSNGGLTICNIPLVIGTEKYKLFRPLNSREPWPLYAQNMDGIEWRVFTDEGELTKDFLTLIQEK